MKKQADANAAKYSEANQLKPQKYLGVQGT
jgi:hypothetical protein